MNTSTILIISGLALLIWFFVSFATILKIIAIRRTPTTWISALGNEGRAEVVGKIGQKTVHSPFENTPCALWQINVQEFRHNNKGSSWVNVFHQTSKDPFEIMDETGTILVNPEGADLILHEDYSSGQLNKAGLEQLSRLGVSTTSWLGFDKKLRLQERRLKQGDDVYVIGDISQSNGLKSIANSATSRMVITDRSERELLNSLY